jgi:hypothetical protein
VICAFVGAAERRGFHHSDHSATERIRVAPPIHTTAILVAVRSPCWATKEPISAPTRQEAQTERGAIARSSASAAPAPRRQSEPRRRLAFRFEPPALRTASDHACARPRTACPLNSVRRCLGARSVHRKLAA